MSSVSPHPQRLVRSRIIPSATSRPSPGRWRPSSPTVTWPLRLVVLTARRSHLSSKRWSATVRSPTWTPDQVAAVFAELWADRAPATWNTRRVAIQAFAVWCDERWPLAADPLATVAPRRRLADNTRAISYEDLEELWRRRGVSLREKTLWRMLYETAARASEVLALDVEGLDRARRRAPIRSKGGSTDMVVWAAPTARLLGRYLADRATGPLFLTRHRSRTAPARRDLYEPTGQARLSYRTAAAEFRRHSDGWTLHQLRHSSLTHLAEAGASAVMLQAKSRHRDLRTLSLYTRPGVEAVARMTAERFDRPDLRH